MTKLPPVTIRSIAGLWNSPNPFSKVPEGALAVADNVVIRANGVLEPMRGYDGALPFSSWNKLVPAQDGRAFGLQAGISFLWPLQVSAGVVSQTAPVALGGFPNLDAKSYAQDPRVSPQFAFANQTALCTFQHGPLVALMQDINYPGLAGHVVTPNRIAGLPRCPAPGLALIAATGNAVMNTGKRRTYRVTVAWFDPIGNFYESAPSEPVWIENGTGGDRTVQFTLYWPLALQSWDVVTRGFGLGGLTPFFRIWRALETATGVSANDEMFLIREVVPSSYTFKSWPTNDGKFLDPNVTQTVNDVSVDSLLNVPLYTNPQTGDSFGILAANRRPPSAAAIAYFKGRMYYGRCSYQQQLAIQIIGTGAGGVNTGDTITIDGIVYTAGGAGLESTRVFNCPTGAGAVASNIDTAAKSLIECIRQVYGTAAGVGYGNQIHRQLYAYYASNGTNDFGRIIIERPLPVSNGDDSAIPFSVVTTSAGVRFPLGSTTSSDDYVPGGMSWSKPDEPEAVPDTNFQIVGDANRALLGFSVHRDAMIIYKEDGAYILRDDGGPVPTVDLLDASVICVAPASIAVVSNLAYLLSTRGVVQVSEQGTDLVSFPIFAELDALYRLSGTSLATAYGFGHESERLYALCVPASAQETTSSYQYVLRVPEADSPLPKWTRWKIPGAAAACVIPQTNQILFGLLNASFNLPGLLLERRGHVVSLDYFDNWRSTSYAAPSGTLATVTLSGDQRANIDTGDLLLYNPGGVGTKVYTPRVVTVAYNSGTNQTTLTLDSAVPFAGSTFSTLPAIRSRWRFLPIVAGEPTMEKQHTYVQGYFSYFDGDWLDMKLDNEGSILSPFSKVYADPQNSNLGGTLALSFPGGGTPNPAPPTPCGQIQWLRNCRDVVLRLDPGRDEARGARIGVEMQFAQAQARFQLAAISIAIGEVNDTGAR